MAVFAHPDDESFVAGTLFQVTNEFDITTHLMCLTKGGRGKNAYNNGNLKQIREKELRKATAILGVDKLTLFDFPDGNLRKTRSKWLSKIKEELKQNKYNIVLTFDYSGITGHPDHIISCHEIFKLLKSNQKRPDLVWRVPDKREKKYFVDNKAFNFASIPNMELDTTPIQTIRKIKAIYTHKSQMPNLRFKLQILDWYLLDHKEYYYKVDFNKEYKYKFVDFKF